MGLTKLIRRLLLAGLIAAALGSIAMRLVVRSRQVDRVVQAALAPAQGDRLPSDAAPRCAEIIRQRIEYLKSRYAVARYRVRVLAPDRLEILVRSHLDVEPLLDRVLKRFAFELREVLNYDYRPAAGDPLPPGAETLDEVQHLYDLRCIGQVDEERKPRLVRARPAMVIEQFESVKFLTRTLRRDPIIVVAMKPADARRFAQVTARCVGKRLAVVINGEIRTAPLVRRPIRGGRAEIHGIVFKQEARDLAAFLRLGALPCRVVRAPRRLAAARPRPASRAPSILSEAKQP